MMQGLRKANGVALSFVRFFCGQPSTQWEDDGPTHDASTGLCDGPIPRSWARSSTTSSRELWTHARIGVHSGKTHWWCSLHKCSRSLKQPRGLRSDRRLALVFFLFLSVYFTSSFFLLFFIVFPVFFFYFFFMFSFSPLFFSLPFVRHVAP